MAPNRFRKENREKRELTPFNDEPLVREEVPPEWRDIEAPVNFTWVAQDELAGMGWPKSRDQVRFCVEQGIDHLITLSPEKFPPYYAFPDLKWTLIPVEDFTGPTIADIKKFITLMDEARKEGEAIGVHCAEGRGRTGVMCACYLIYYHDMKPWDAIRIMRRQRPGSVERKAQEETVVLFWTLLQDYGKSTLEVLEEKEKEMKKMMKSLNNGALPPTENALLGHTNKFFGPPTPEIKIEKRAQRAKSMPKINQEEEEEINFRQHMQSFFQSRRHNSRHERRSRSQPHHGTEKKKTKVEKDAANTSERNNDRAVTPGRSLLGNLKPVHRRTKLSANSEESGGGANDFTKHFKDFMSTSSSISFRKANHSPNRKGTKISPLNAKKSENKSKECDGNDTSVNTLSRRDSSEEKYVVDRGQRENNTQKSASEGDQIKVNFSISLRRSLTPSSEEEDEEEVDEESLVSSSSRSTSCSERTSESKSRSSSPYTSSSDNSTMSSSSSSESLKDLQTSSLLKPQFDSGRESAETYSYYSRVRSKAAASRLQRRESNRSELSNRSNCNDSRRPSVSSVSPTRNESAKDSRFRRAQTEFNERNQPRNSYSSVDYAVNSSNSMSSTKNSYITNQGSSYSRFTLNLSPIAKARNSHIVDRALSGLKPPCGGSTLLTRRLRMDKSLEYPSPIVRDSWKRTNQRFNYSKFFSTSPETYV